MNDHLAKRYLSDAALSFVDDSLLRCARRLYQCGFASISSAQMAAVADRIRRAATLEKAKEETAAFLSHQMAKLKAKHDRQGKATSWYEPASGAGAGQALGDLLMDWIQNERYLNGADKDVISILDRLAALQRFWARFHVFYRYGAKFNEDLPPTEIEEAEKP